MITKDKVTEIFCIIDEFDKNLDMEMRKNLFCHPKSLVAKGAGTVREGFPGAR